ncbi:hypothetical protein BN1708_010443 [Verticillium longisporum]|uniref:Uncharacterized protein n=1 Tax=Verticillium longisporum TaxID=100787 RepID=A0A0G4KRJ9_VERLO|nr:hypothetical protein BN1708_010443 [Verticillium longisporum]
MEYHGALAQAASYLRETLVGVAMYLEIYQHKWDELASSKIKNESDTAATLLRLWAILDDEYIWHGILAVGASHPSVRQVASVADEESQQQGVVLTDHRPSPSLLSDRGNRR